MSCIIKIKINFAECYAPTCHPLSQTSSLGRKRDLVHLVSHWFVRNRIGQNQKKKKKEGPVGITQFTLLWETESLGLSPGYVT